MKGGSGGPAGGDSRDGGSDPDETKNAQFFSEVLWRGILANQWSMESLGTKARSIRNAGAVVLSVLVVGLVGLGGLLDGDVANLAGFSPLPGWALFALTMIGLAGMGITVASMGLATKALGIFVVHSPVAKKNFTESGEGGDISDELLEACARFPTDVAPRMHRAYLRRIDELARSVRSMGGLVRRAQWAHFIGLSCIGAASIPVLGSMAWGLLMP